MTWVIVGATSIIAQEFARIVAASGYPLLLVGRNLPELQIIAADLTLRYHVQCDVMGCDLSSDISMLINFLQWSPHNFSLFIAASVIEENQHLNPDTIKSMIQVNILSITLLINAYFQKTQIKHRLIFLSSVAACRGRSKNSLYGSSKAAIEIYLQGLQQEAYKTQTITIARLGFIDTAQTYGLPGIFYASPPKKCAQACWKASQAGKRQIYHPFFWRYIMGIITSLPFIIYRRLKL